jgi:hypothetical protein
MLRFAPVFLLLTACATITGPDLARDRAIIGELRDRIRAAERNGCRRTPSGT